MSIQKKKRTINGKQVTYYYPVISTYKIDKCKTPLWGPGFENKSEAVLEEARMKKALQKSPFAERFRDKILFKDIRDAWIETRYSKNTATRERDINYCNMYLCVFDDMDIRKITPLDLQDWVNLLAKRYAPKTIAMAFNLMSQIMNYAIEPLQILRENPCNANIQRPSPKRRGIDSEKYWSEAELKRFLSHPLTQADSYYRLYTIHAAFGMRPGEICGISVNDVDLGARRLTLNHGIDKKGRLTNLKNSGAQRTLTIPPQLIPLFQEQINFSNTIRRKDLNYPFMFVTDTGGPISPDTYCQHFQRAIQRINRIEPCLKPLTPYGLRHTFATLSLFKGIHIKVVAEIMGDSVETVMANYVHVMDQMSADSLEMFAGSILS